ISVKELSLSTGISQSTISKFLSGNQEPKFSQIIAVAKALHIPPDVFMSFVNPALGANPPFINEYCMIRELYNNAGAHLHITSFYAFKEFTIEVPVINDEALYVVAVLEGRTDSKLGPLCAGDVRVIKGIDYKGVKVTVHKGTKNIVFILHESLGDTIKSWSKIFFESIEQQKK
ncbi:MAG: helix-turn-helix transcriptional regulator, partial [Bacteroidetes bacterium]|nr:helix-turn-helix transcriptional regulator [Bacteroidota bacterium]